MIDVHLFKDLFPIRGQLLKDPWLSLQLPGPFLLLLLLLFLLQTKFKVQRHCININILYQTNAADFHTTYPRSTYIVRDTSTAGLDYRRDWDCPARNISTSRAAIRASDFRSALLGDPQFQTFKEPILLFFSFLKFACLPKSGPPF